MAVTKTEIESQAVALSAEAFEAFCEDISGMFGVDMECAQQEVAAETAKGLKKRFKKLVAVNSVKAEGALDGTFQLVFDQGGLFTLSGIIVMLPENRILEEIKRGSIKDVEAMNDVLKEAGNMLVGSWDRVFREGLEGHGHFVQTNTFIGTPWDKPEETIDLANGEEFTFVPYEMTIGSYPSFNCGVIFPKTIFEPASKSDDEQAKPDATEKVGVAEEKPEASAEVKPQEKTEEKEEKTPAEKTTAKEDTQETVETNKEASADKPKPAEKKPEVKKATDEQESTAKEEPEATVEEKNDNVDTKASDSAVEEKEVTTNETNEPKKSVAGRVSETIQEVAQSPAVLPGESDPPTMMENAVAGSSEVALAVCAEEIMEKDIVWGSPDDSVQQTLTKMQQNDSGYLMVGTDGVLEGIVSKSDIAGAISPYLRPAFAKWRRPLDDATLKIRIKWIMSRPVRTIKPETSLAAIMESMCQFGGWCLPVLNQQGKVQGLVTVFDIFKVLNSNLDIFSIGKSPQAPPLA